MAELSNRELINEIDKVQSQTMKVIKATEVVLILTFIGYVVIIMQKLGVI